MSVIDFDEIIREMKDGDDSKTIVEGQDFDVMLMKGESKLHICGADEFFYVLEGEGELVVDDELYVLKQGEGIMVSAGVKHQRRNPDAY